MVDPASEAGDAFKNALRQAASHQADVASKYQRLLTEFSTQLDFVEFATGSAETAIQGGARLAQDSLNLQIAFWQFVAQSIGKAVEPKPNPDETAH
jgi:hypothetical protein